MIMSRHILTSGEGDIFNIIIKKFCRVFCKSSLESTLWQFPHTVAHNYNSWQVVCFFSSPPRHFPGGYPLPGMELYLDTRGVE